MSNSDSDKIGRKPLKNILPGLDTVNHIAIQVNDIGRAITWYQSLFQTIVEYQDESWALLRFRNINLALVKPDQHPAHIAIEHENAEAFGSLSQHRDGTRSIYINDSEGNSIELLST